MKAKHPVKIKWLLPEEGGRKSLPQKGGRYFPVSKWFPEDTTDSNAWSVVFDIESTCLEKDRYVSRGMVHFLVDKAPQERMVANRTFDIYEGPHKVATAFLLST